MSNEHKEKSLKKLAEEESPGFFREMLDLLLTNKKWWLAPILIVIVLLGAFVLLSGTAAAPFIYTLF